MWPVKGNQTLISMRITGAVESIMNDASHATEETGTQSRDQKYAKDNRHIGNIKKAKH